MKILKNILICIVVVTGILACAVGIVSMQDQSSYTEAAQSLWFRLLRSCGISVNELKEAEGIAVNVFSYEDIPDWNGTTPFVEVNYGIPYFTEEDLDIQEGMIIYSTQDNLGRCGPAAANICSMIMPAEERDDTQERLTVIPSGYRQKQYPEDLVEHGYLYNRCHLLGWQLGGDACANNLIAGTRYMNVEGMLPYENKAAGYVRSHPSNHVIYRVTPVFTGQELNCRGILMEAYSLEDNGRLEFCVFVYNEQPGIRIDHSDGSSWEEHIE